MSSFPENPLHLRAAGHDVHDFFSANEFHDAIGSEAFGWVVVEACIHGISGKKAAGRATGTLKFLSIIVATADDNPENIREAHGDL
jgi:hypothetical protein